MKFQVDYSMMTMKNNYGLNLCKSYFEEVAKPMLEKECPQVLKSAAFGLVGEGSECFGYDDEISRDHDWGPGFCIWLSDEDYAKYGEKLTWLYDNLPKEYMGYTRLRVCPETQGRVGVMRVSDFYCKYTGLNRAPQHLNEWRFLPDSNFAVATNGQIWMDGDGQFTSIRKKILSFYPEDVRKKKLSKRAAVAAQSGQYNFYRCAQRENFVATFQTKGIFVEHIIAIVFLLNLRFCPYYKWASKEMRELPILGEEIYQLTSELCRDNLHPGNEIEKISELIIKEFANQNLSHSSSDFLLDHGKEILASIQDESLRNTHIMGD